MIESDIKVLFDRCHAAGLPYTEIEAVYKAFGREALEDRLAQAPPPIPDEIMKGDNGDVHS